MKCGENDEQLELWKARFPKYTENLCRIERRYYQAFDPSWHLRVLQQMERPSDLSWLDSFSSQEEGLEQYELVSEDTDFETFRATFSRMLRYMSSESLLIMFASGYPYGPTPAAAQSLKYRSLVSLIDKIAQSELPNSKDYSTYGIGVSFDEWAGYMFFRENRSPDELQSYIDFVVREARFISDRSAINAFKHSRMLRPVDGTSARIRTREGIDLSPEISSALQWTELAIKSSSGRRQQQSTISYEEMNFENDCEAIFGAAALMTLLRSMRLGMLEELDEINMILPKIDAGSSLPFRFRLTETSNYRESSSE